MDAVRWSDEAERDLVQILDFIGEQNPAAADRLQARFSPTPLETCSSTP